MYSLKYSFALLDHKDDTDIEESARTTFVDHVSDEHFEKRKLKKGIRDVMFTLLIQINQLCIHFFNNISKV